MNAAEALAVTGLPSATAVEQAKSRPFSKGMRGYLLALLCLISLVNMLDRHIFAILMEPIKRDMQLTDTQLGLITGGAFAVAYTFAGIPLSRLVDTGRRRVILAGTLLFWSGMTMFCGAARNYVQLLIGRLGVAVGESGGIPATMSIVGDLYPKEKRSGAIGLIYTFGIVGAAGSLFVGGYLEGLIGWRETFLVVGAPGLVLALLLLFTVSEPPRQAPGVHTTLWASLAAAWQVPSFRILTLMSAFFSFSGTAMLAWAPSFLIRVHGFSPAQVGQILGTAIICGASGSLVSGFLADWAAKRDLRWLLLITAIGPVLATLPMLVFLYGADPWLLFFSYAVFQFLKAMFVAPSYAAVIGVTPGNNRAFTIVLMAMVQNVGSMTGPLAIGMMNDVLASRVGGIAIRYSLTTTLFAALAVGALALLGARHIKRDFDAAQIREDEKTSQ